MLLNPSVWLGVEARHERLRLAAAFDEITARSDQTPDSAAVGRAPRSVNATVLRSVHVRWWQVTDRRAVHRGFDSEPLLLSGSATTEPGSTGLIATEVEPRDGNTAFWYSLSHVCWRRRVVVAREAKSRSSPALVCP